MAVSSIVPPSADRLTSCAARSFSSSISTLSRTDSVVQQQAQVTVLVAMPTQYRCSGPLSDYEIGTRVALCAVEKEKPKAVASSDDRLIMMDICTYGYLG